VASEPKLPRGIVQTVLGALEAEGWCTIGFDRPVRAALLAVLPAIERAALKRAAERILFLEALAKGWRCPACHGKPASAPHLYEGRTGYTCGCGHAWEPPKRPDYGMEPERLLRRLARGEPLPKLPEKAIRAQLGEDGSHG